MRKSGKSFHKRKLNYQYTPLIILITCPAFFINSIGRKNFRITLNHHTKLLKSPPILCKKGNLIFNLSCQNIHHAIT